MEVLALDIGGTNARIGLLEAKGKKISLKEKRIFSTKNVYNIPKLINGFGKNAERACFAVAGPIAGKKAKLTNAVLTIDISKVKKETRLKHVALVNDFHANAAALPFLRKSDIFALNKCSAKDGIKMVIGAGTGLGKSYVIDGKIFPSEGGHTIVGVEDIDEYALVDYIKKKIKGTVCYEDVLSGRGISEIYEYLEIKSNLTMNGRMHRLIQEADRKPEIITENYKKDKLSGLAVRLFVKFYARFARDSALNTLCSEIYLAGGIAKAIKDPMKEGFMKEFLNHRHYSSLLKKMKVALVMNPDIGLIG